MISLLSMFSFVKSPIGMLVVGVIALTGWTTYQRHDAAQDARVKCEAAQAAAALKEIARQDMVAAEAQKRAEAEWKKASDELVKLKELRDGILKIEIGTDTCVISDDIRNRLSDIR